MNSVDFVCYQCGGILDEVIAHTQEVGLHCSKKCFEADKPGGFQAKTCTKIDALMLECAKTALMMTLAKPECAKEINNMAGEEETNLWDVLVEINRFNIVKDGVDSGTNDVCIWPKADETDEAWPPEMFETARRLQSLVQGKIALLTIELVQKPYPKEIQEPYYVRQHIILFHDGKAKAPVKAAASGEAGSADDECEIQ